jgi:hypothetical protein
MPWLSRLPRMSRMSGLRLWRLWRLRRLLHLLGWLPPLLSRHGLPAASLSRSNIIVAGYDKVDPAILVFTVHNFMVHMHGTLDQSSPSPGAA